VALPPMAKLAAFGVDVNAVKQRGFAQDFSFLNPQYRIMTGHASLYWDAGFLNATLRAGQYLAGDKGATLDLSRVFRNGVKMVLLPQKQMFLQHSLVRAALTRAFM